MPKLPSRAYKLLWDAHSAAGIVIGLALFVLFATGALLLFRGEVRQWEEPDLRPTTGEPQSISALTTPVLDSLGQGEALPSYVYMTLPKDADDNLYVHASGSTVGPSHNTWVNTRSGDWVGNPHEGALTQTLYHLHFFFQFGTWGLHLAGLLGLFGLLAVTTGTLVHVNRLVKDFFQFRPTKSLRVAWADAHKVLGTIGLPFQTMYVFTGAYFGLVGLIAMLYAPLLFDGNTGTFYREAGYYAPTVQVDSAEVASGERPRLGGLVDRADRTWSDFTPETVVATGLGTPTARIEVVGRTKGTVFGGTGAVVFHGQTGEVLLTQPPSEAGALNDAVQTMEQLHFADFGGLALQILFFLLALASCGVILTGNLTWLEVRRGQDRWINRILARLTAGVATGMLPALAVLFLADRWLPRGRAIDEWTDIAFFSAWALVAAYALVRSNVARSHRHLLTTGGLLCLLVPIANGTTTGTWLWTAWSTQQWSVLGVDVGALLLGTAALGLAAGITVDAASTPEDDADAAPAPASAMTQGENAVSVPSAPSS